METVQQPVTEGNVAKRPVKKKKNQLPAALVLLVLIVGFAVFLGQSSPVLAISWIFGIGFGVVLQKSRFCFTAAFRDPVLTGSTSISKAVLIAIAVALVGFAMIQFNAVKHGAAVPGFVNPVGLHVAIGAVMFGIGAVISGGCASGTLMRVGEGFQMQWLSLVFFVVGSLWGAHDFSWWQETVMKAAPK
ncbi:MAG TPA: YeeE/YedE thiosulfate transporter family protein, partial [Bacillota bacterium]|nr:YeeE/YedE thiosulfate transporter family protein [Bacillota bacterium]